MSEVSRLRVVCSTKMQLARLSEHVPQFLSAYLKQHQAAAA